MQAQSSVHKNGSLSRNPVQAGFRCFVSLQGKTLFIWQIKVAKTAKAKLCATKTGITILSFVPLQRKTAVSLTNQGCKGCQNEALCHKNRHNYPKNSAQAEFLCFCVFAGKNTVYLANQSCNGCQNEALCHKARHRGSRDALAPIKP